MSETEFYPVLCVKNLQQSIEFYSSILNFKVLSVNEELHFATLIRGSYLISIDSSQDTTWSFFDIAELNYPFGRGVSFKLEMNSISGIKEKLTTFGVRTFQHADFPTRIEFLDLDGYLWNLREAN